MDNATGGPVPVRKVRARRLASLAAEAAFRERLVQLGAELLEPEWLGNAKPHHVRCRAGHDCYPRPGGLRDGQGPCITCAGQNPAVVEAAFRVRLVELGAILLEPEWLGAMRKHHVRCKAGHDCYPKPNGVQQGRGICRRCAGSDPRDAEAAFRARLAELGAELLESYHGSQEPHRVRCAAGHEGRPRPSDVAKGDGICRMCSGKHPAVAEARFLRALDELGAAPLYERWLGSDKRHRVRCPAGHECEPTPAAVWRWRTVCRICSGKDPATSEAKFLARLEELGAAPLYDAWRGSHEPHLVRCVAGHDCRPDPSSVIQGHGVCRFCTGAIWDAFYVVTSTDAVKFGITTGDPRPRLRIHARQGLKSVARLATGLPGITAPSAEAAVKAALALAGEKPLQGREYFDISCLALVLDVADSWLSLPAAPFKAADSAGEWLQEMLFAA